MREDIVVTVETEGDEAFRRRCDAFLARHSASVANLPGTAFPLFDAFEGYRALVERMERRDRKDDGAPR